MLTSVCYCLLVYCFKDGIGVLQRVKFSEISEITTYFLYL